mmetsp:Transcript_32118/g.92329  ORF Transcript_32118/g.92329 Transcript_32118/m.92329 type:complete len:281 (-) Transcript_32118:270-1112(-)
MRCGSYFSSSKDAGARATPGKGGLQCGCRSFVSGRMPSLEGPMRSPSVTSNSKASFSSSARVSSSSRVVWPISCGGLFFRPTCRSCHLARTFVTLDSRMTRRRVAAASTCTLPKSTMTGSALPQWGRSAWSTSRGRSSSALGWSVTRTAGRREQPTRCTRWRSTALLSSETSRGYSTMTSPWNVCSVLCCVHSDSSTMSSANSTCSVTVSIFATTKRWRRGSSAGDVLLALLRVARGSDAGFTGCRPTCAISRIRKGPSTRKEQAMLQAVLFDSVTFRTM